MEQSQRELRYSFTQIRMLALELGQNQLLDLDVSASRSGGFATSHSDDRVRDPIHNGGRDRRARRGWCHCLLARPLG
jgi:hypothetical protein